MKTATVIFPPLEHFPAGPLVQFKKSQKNDWVKLPKKTEKTEIYSPSPDILPTFHTKLLLNNTVTACKGI